MNMWQQKESAWGNNIFEVKRFAILFLIRTYLSKKQRDKVHIRKPIYPGIKVYLELHIRIYHRIFGILYKY